MDQDSSNGSEPDKRNWRERLGIGATELPKLSDEFREEAAPAPAPVVKAAPSAPRPVTKPAPMAPRRPPASVAAPAVPPVASRATPRAPDNAAQDALAEKLRAQRAAAEKLAEQRVQAARNRAEGKVTPAEPPSLGAARPLGSPSGSSLAARAPGATPPVGAGRPKFSFADEPSSRLSGDAAARPGLGGAPLVPPRPALGGDRGQPPFLRPSAAGSSLSGRTPPSSYRPPEPGAGFGGSSPRLQLPASPRTGLGGDAQAYPGARVPARRPVTPPPSIDPYARQIDSRDGADGDYPDEGRQPPRLGRPVPTARPRAAEDNGFDDVFEDEAAPRQRPTARDYQAAYREDEGAFGDERRRSSGPWLLLLALLAAALATGAVVWFYSGGMKNLANIGGGTDTVPVVSSPDVPAKVAPEGTADTGGEAPAARKKQIYDRIVGEQEVTDGAQVQPTEETPVQPGDAQQGTGQQGDAQPAGQIPKVEPAAGATQIPAPDAATQGATGQGLPDVEEPPPLPVPPAGTGQEGSLTQKPLNQVASAAEQAVQGAAAPPPPLPDAQQTSSSNASPPPPPEKATDGAALVSEATSAADTAASDAAAVDKAAEAKAAEEQAAAEKAAALKAAEKKKAAEAAAKKKAAAAKKKAVDYDNLGSEPVVLVAPSQSATAQPEIVQNAPAGEVAAEVPAPSKKKTIFDLFGGNSGAGGGTAAAPQAETQVAAAPQQTRQATAPAAKQAAVPQQASTGGGYIAQLASFRSDAEARQEYLRLKGAYPNVVGNLAQQIRPANVGGSTRYQLALGPMGSRAEASSVCSALISAGESDCIVRGP